MSESSSKDITIVDIENPPASSMYSNIYSVSPSLISGEDDYKWLRITDFRQDDEPFKESVEDDFYYSQDGTEELPTDRRPKLDEVETFDDPIEDVIKELKKDPRPKLDSIPLTVYASPDGPKTPEVLPPIDASRKISTESNQDKKPLQQMERSHDTLEKMSDKMLRSMQKYHMNVGKLLMSRSNKEEPDHHKCHDLQPTPHAYEFGPAPPKPETSWTSKHSLSPRDRQHSFPKFSRYASEAETASSLPLVSVLQEPSSKKDSFKPSSPLKVNFPRKAKKYHKATQVSLLEGSPLKPPNGSRIFSDSKSTIAGGTLNIPKRMVRRASQFKRRKSSLINSPMNSILSMRPNSSAAQFTFNMRQKQGSRKLQSVHSQVFEEDEEEEFSHRDSFIEKVILEAQGGDETEEPEESTDKKSAKVLQKAKELTRINRRAKLGCMRLCWADILSWWKHLRVRKEDNPLFSKQLKQIEGHFGSGIMAFFLFLRWIFMLNLIVAVVWLLFIILPQIFHFDYSKPQSSFEVIDLLTGEGPLGESWLFYGSYDTMVHRYPLAFMYLLCIMFTYFGGFFLVLKSLAVSIEEEGLQLKRTEYKLLQLVFTSWDYSLQTKEGSRNLSMGLTHTFKEIIRELEVAKDTEAQSKKEHAEVFTRRACAWMITLFLVGSGCSIIFVVLSSVDVWAKQLGYDNGDSWIVTYGPTFVFITINSVVPEIVYLLPLFEKYSRGQDEIHITIARVFVLRIINVLALMISLQQKVRAGHYIGCAGTVVGQELYKLVLIDTIVGIGTVLLPNYVKYCWYKKKQEFEMPAQVLKVLYRQALIWLGTIVCPLMPVFGMASTAIFFFTNYISVMQTCKPPEKRWNQPRRSTFFVGTTVATLIFVIAVISFVIAGKELVFLGEVSNSTEYCGPFQNNSMTSVFNVWKQDVENTNPSFGNFLQVITSGTVVTPLVFILLAVLYYQRLRIHWEEKRNAVAFAELQQERELLRALHIADKYTF